MAIHKSKLLGDIVKQNYLTARIFEHFGLDYSFHGKKSIEDACKEKCINPYEVTAELTEFLNRYNSAPKMFDLWEIDYLSDYIVNNHHSFVRTKCTLIKELINNFLQTAADGIYEFKDISKYFNLLSEILEIHMQREERTVFPFIKKLVAHKKANNISADNGRETFRTVQIPIEAMENEHQKIGEIISRIKVLCNNFTPPSGSGVNVNAIYNELSEFEHDLHMHIHLENNILFPKAIFLENELTLKKDES